MLLGTFGASLSGNLLTGKGILREIRMEKEMKKKNDIRKKKELQEVVLKKNGIFNTASFFHKL